MIKKQTKPEIKKEVVYGLRHIETRKLLCINRTSNEGSDFCGEYTVKLDYPYSDEKFDQNTWYTDELYNAEYVRQYPTEWYNSDEKTPDHQFEPEELEVVEVQREVRTIQHIVKIPTFLEYMELRYKDKERAHYDYVKKEYEKSPNYARSWTYNLYELQMLIQDGKWKPEEGKNNGSGNKSKTKKTRKEL